MLTIYSKTFPCYWRKEKQTPVKIFSSLSDPIKIRKYIFAKSCINTYLFVLAKIKYDRKYKHSRRSKDKEANSPTEKSIVALEGLDSLEDKSAIEQWLKDNL